MFFWSKRRRRERLIAEPFPPRWEAAIRTHVPAYRHLSDPEARKLRQLTRLLIAEKYWDGAGGFELDDVTKAIIAAQGSMLILELGIDAYARLQTIVVYPSTVRPPRAGSVLGSATLHDEQRGPLVGEARMRGPMILSWDAALAGGQNDHDGHNVVYHEFAHILDMASGSADGIPPLGDEQTYQRWRAVLDCEYETLVDLRSRGRKTFLDGYAATNPAEFFAVATEQFFEQPETFERKHATLYGLMAQFYRQDPVTRAAAGTGRATPQPPRRFEEGRAVATSPGDEGPRGWRKWVRWLSG